MTVAAHCEGCGPNILQSNGENNSVLPKEIRGHAGRYDIELGLCARDLNGVGWSSGLTGDREGASTCLESALGGVNIVSEGSEVLLLKLHGGDDFCGCWVTLGKDGCFHFGLREKKFYDEKRRRETRRHKQR